MNTAQDEFVQIFISESEELLSELDNELVTLERNPEDLDTARSFFRNIHTFKSSADHFKLEALKTISHRLEDLLEKMIEESRAVSPSILELMFDGIDLLRKYFKAYVHDPAGNDNDVIPTEFIKRLEQALYEEEDLTESLVKAYKSIQDELKQNESFSHLSGILDRMTEQYYGIEGEGSSEEGEGEAGDKGEENSEAIEEFGANRSKTPRRAVAKSIRVHEDKIDKFLDSVGELITTGEVLKTIQNNMASVQKFEAHLVKEFETINIDFRDQIFSLQDSLMELRRVELDQIISQYPRMLRDIAISMGKEVQFNWRGEGSYFDKSLYDDLDAVLIHILRNAIDHGIEDTETRKEKGKSPQGTIDIDAFNDDTNLVIQIKDDGRGIDVNRLKSLALSKGLFSGGALARMTDEEAMNIMFMPGISTAKEVSEISGRGVGMDVVNEFLQKRAGHINVTSKIDEGTTLRLYVPLKATLGVIDGLTVVVKNIFFIIPAQSILSSLKPEPKDIISLAQKRCGVKIRGKSYPLIHLGSRFNLIPDDEVDYQEGICILLYHKGREMAIWVDEILEKKQIVLKDLEGLSKSPDIKGGAIMGSGQVGLVVNIEGIFGDAFQFEAI